MVGVKDPAQGSKVGFQGHLLEVTENGCFNLVGETYLPFPNLPPDPCKGDHPYNQPRCRNHCELVETFLCHDLHHLIHGHLGLDADGEGETEAGTADQPKKKRRLKKSATVEKNLKNINVNKFELEFDVDPLFKKTSSQFDSGSGGNQFLASLQIR